MVSYVLATNVASLNLGPPRETWFGLVVYTKGNKFAIAIQHLLAPARQTMCAHDAGALSRGYRCGCEVAMRCQVPPKTSQTRAIFPIKHAPLLIPFPRTHNNGNFRPTVEEIGVPEYLSLVTSCQEFRGGFELQDRLLIIGPLSIATSARRQCQDMNSANIQTLAV
jgi:hypothetical protein